MYPNQTAGRGARPTLLTSARCYALQVAAGALSLFFAPVSAGQISEHIDPMGLIDVTDAVGLGDYRAGAGDTLGGGGIFTDLDEDGYPDLVLLTGPGEPNYIYHNVPGTSPGKRVFQALALGGVKASGSTGAIAADYDGDGDLDIYVINHSGNMGAPCQPTDLCSPNTLYENRGNLSFIEVTQTYPLQNPPQGGVPNTGVSHSIWADDEDPFTQARLIVLDNAMAATWADVDRDGDLDLYVGNHDGWADQTGEDPFTFGQRDILFLNMGNNIYIDRTETYGVCGYTDCRPNSARPRRFSSAIAAAFTDINGDQWPDLLVINKAGGGDDTDMLYLNRGMDDQGRWQGFVPERLPQHAGTGSRGLAIADVDSDGDMDFFRTGSGLGVLFQTRSETQSVSFQELTKVYPGQGMGAAWIDLENDGYPELYVARDEGLRDFTMSLGNFSTGTPWLADESPGPSRAVLTADYDRDGDTDLFVIRLNRNDTPTDSNPSVFWENRIPTITGNGFISVKLRGNGTEAGPFPSRIDALGAKVVVSATRDGVILSRQVKELRSSNGFTAATNDQTLLFGIGRADSIDLVVHWPSGRTTMHSDIDPNRFLEIVEPAVPAEYP